MIFLCDCVIPLSRVMGQELGQMRDFSGQNLRGRNFRGQDLRGANFSGADIRGAKFTDAELQGADFSGAKAGLKRHWVFGQTVIAFVLS
jgi:Pentapeptide repeats (8 copies)